MCFQTGSSSMFYGPDRRSQLKALTEQVDHLQHVNQVLTKNMEKLEQVGTFSWFSIM